jgi:hypothetical protein
MRAVALGLLLVIATGGAITPTKRWVPKKPLQGGVNAIAAGSRSRTVAARSQVRESVEERPVSVTIA